MQADRLTVQLVARSLATALDTQAGTQVVTRQLEVISPQLVREGGVGADELERALRMVIATLPRPLGLALEDDVPVVINPTVVAQTLFASTRVLLVGQEHPAAGWGRGVLARTAPYQRLLVLLFDAFMFFLVRGKTRDAVKMNIHYAALIATAHSELIELPEMPPPPPVPRADRSSIIDDLVQAAMIEFCRTTDGELLTEETSGTFRRVAGRWERVPE